MVRSSLYQASKRYYIIYSYDDKNIIRTKPPDQNEEKDIMIASDVQEEPRCSIMLRG